MLTDLDRQILDFEKQWWRHAGVKEARIFQQFQLTPASFYQRLNALLDVPAAHTYSPQVVARLR